MTISNWILNRIQPASIHLKKISIGVVALCAFVFVIKLFTFKINFSEKEYANTNFEVLGLNIPTTLDFAGEKVPQNDYEIKESLEQEFYENKSWKSSSLILFSKAKKWFPLIEPILKKEGVPNDFKYVAVIESHLANVVSPMGAAGFWQLMPQTAQGYGLIVNSEVDERYDVEKATYAACKHFKEAYQYFHNWTLSAAAYNVGIGGIQQAMKKQGTNNYYDLLLNKETSVFIYRILAYKTLLSNPEHFGVKSKLNKLGSFPAFKIVKVDSTITNLHAFAKHLNTDIVTLKTFNAWLIGNQLANPEKREYAFKIPKNKQLDLSLYFEDVFPQENTADTLISIQPTDTIHNNVESLLKK